ncbi:hypothetical protein MASSI9I_100081 [Massilia sp. 9I]|nr:hypothetical protein MASSI9I_100081 [Massilia sp. 9I]
MDRRGAPPGHHGVAEPACTAPPRRRHRHDRRRGRLQRPSFPPCAQERRARGGGRPRCRRAHPAGAPAAQRTGSCRGGLSPAALGPYARRPILPVEFVRAAAAAFCRRLAPGTRHVGVYQPRHRLLGAAEALRRAVGDHAGAPGAGLSPNVKTPTFHSKNFPDALSLESLEPMKDPTHEPQYVTQARQSPCPDRSRRRAAQQ